MVRVNKKGAGEVGPNFELQLPAPSAKRPRGACEGLGVLGRLFSELLLRKQLRRAEFQRLNLWKQDVC